LLVPGDFETAKADIGLLQVGTHIARMGDFVTRLTLTMTRALRIVA
jgi:hypothetical protein